ncbi:MAG: hypothetical protein IH978_07785 [Nitrospinae bacterium]|nr:hypothetical protein [Nitrospinota bacterium]
MKKHALSLTEGFASLRQGYGRQASGVLTRCCAHVLTYAPRANGPAALLDGPF